MGSEFETLLLHTEVRWLSRGRVLRRMFDLRREVYIFLLNKKHLFTDNKWLGTLSYMVDIFEKLNSLNLNLQGENSSILDLSSKVEAFKNKLTLWHDEFTKNNTDMFPCFSEFINEVNVDLTHYRPTI